MAEKNVTREITVKICDFCGDEVKNLSTCAICKREMCDKDGGKAHAAFNLTDVYRYSDGRRLSIVASKVCDDCAKKRFGGTLEQFFSGMMDESPVPTVEE